MKKKYFQLSTLKILPVYYWSFISAILIGFLTHMYVFTNRIPNWDGMYNIYNSQDKSTSGRFFLTYASGMSGYFDMPWVIGVLSILFLALTAVAIVDLFDIRSKIAAIFISAIVVTFPSVASTFSYMFTADGYLFASFLAILSLVITKRFKYGFIGGGLLLMFSIGIYQANISVVLGFIAIYLITQLIFSNQTTKKIAVQTLQFALTTGLGLVFYFIVYKYYTVVVGIQMTTYQGLDQVGLPALADIPARLVDIRQSLVEFFFYSYTTNRTWNLMEKLNILVFLFIILYSLYAVVKNKIFKDGYRVLLLVLLIVALPLGYYVMYFISPEAGYHMLMVFSISSIYVYLAFILDQTLQKQVTLGRRLTVYFLTPLLFLVTFNFAIISNIAYMNMDLRMQKSLHLSNRLIDRIEQLDEYKDITSVYFVGRVSMYSELLSKNVPNRIPSMVGTVGETFLSETSHYRSMFANYFGYTLSETPKDVADTIMASQEFKEMPLWPAEGSVKAFGEHVIVKFKEEEFVRR